MDLFSGAVRKAFPALLLKWLALCSEPSLAQPAGGAQGTNEIRIMEVQGTVEISRPPANSWIRTTTNQIVLPYDRLRTGPHSRVALRWSDQSVAVFGAQTELEILPPHAADAESGSRLIKGIFSFLHRDKPSRIRTITRGAVAGIKGTDFVLAVDTVDGQERTTLSVIDGTVEFTNELGELVVTNGQQAIAEVGKAPVRTAGFIAENVLQWCFYYPAVLDLADLALTDQEQQSLAESITAYRAGDLLAALDRYPAARPLGSDSERIYYAALVLSVGQVDETEAVLSGLSGREPSDRPQRLAVALRQLIAAVKRQPNPSARDPELATELLAASYYEQSRGIREASLEKALDLARKAVARSPQFGFGWERVAELEFSFGRTGAALEALDKSVALASRNAQALALKGFLLAAQNRTREAVGWFNQALAVDSALGNAWLGRGLCRIRCGDATGGREDLLVAAALEPRRAALRSYLGKAYANEGDFRRARNELHLAEVIDPNDPTAWLYFALLNQQYNRINEGVRDLEKSQELNDNRSVYRSRLLLDQDRAVRSANLAAIYRDAGMFDVSVREASRAVSYDYANFSAHLFLANSYDELRDPNRINLRFETPAESEYLIANLLAPVGAGTLSQTISQQEYSKLFERDRLGVTSSTEYLSRGAWIEQGAQFGTFGNSAYSFEASYRTDPGQRPNNDFEETDLRLHFKQQITEHDSIYVKALYYNAEGGDLIQYYDQRSAIPGLRTEEKQEPILSIGYHREWGPGVHTLLLGSRLSDRLSVYNPAQLTLFVERVPEGLDYAELMSVAQGYHSTLEIYSAELQQIWQTPKHATIVGARFQTGDIHTQNQQTNPSVNVAAFFPLDGVAADQDFTPDFARLSFYGYHQWQIADPLLLVAGLSYDRITFPENFRAAPIDGREETEDQISPKAGVIWTPTKSTTFRAVYTRSLAGAGIDQSIQLEPTQVAGFNQSFRSIIPESVGGAEAGARFETYGVSLDQRFQTGTYLGLTGEIFNSKVNRTFGVFEADFSAFPTPGSTRENIDYRERALLFTFNQLISDQFSVGLRYRLSDADLEDDFPEVLPGVSVPPFRPKQHLNATLHQLTLATIYNHPSGFFAQLQALWNSQSNQGYAPDIPGDDFWQFNALAGYRFAGRKVELTLGVLNLTDQDYRLNPLTLYTELPRERTFLARFHFNF
jgi:tetratricopeptide (TPR) repeat protein